MPAPMVAARRPDRKGRSSSQPIPRDKKFTKIRAPFTGIPVVVMRSDAFRTLGIHARRLLDALLVEHVAHACQENGRLVATYDQLVQEFGIPRRKIRGAIAELEKRGLVRRTAVGCGNRRTGDRQPSMYRLTFLGSAPDRLDPTDEWQSYVAPKAAAKTDRPVSLPDIRGCHMVEPFRVSHGGT
jgi:hypothetical protein